MPIDREEFETSPADSLRVENNAPDDEVLDFLTYDPSKAYTLRELQSVLDLPFIEIAARLTLLREDGKVQHKGSYWIAADDQTTESDDHVAQEH